MELQSSQVSLKALQLDVDKIRKDHAKELENEKRLREVEVQAAKDSMRKAAEDQFGEWTSCTFFYGDYAIHLVHHV